MKKLETKRSVEIYSPPMVQPIVHVSSGAKGISVSSFTMLTLIACMLFMFAYAGVDIGFLIGYGAPPITIAFLCRPIWRQYGKLVAFLSGTLMVVVFATQWGTNFMHNMMLLGAHMQRVSVAGLIVTGVLFLMSLKNWRKHEST